MGTGKNIKKLLTKYGMSAAELSRKTGIPATTLRSIITKDTTPKADTLVQIAAALNCSVTDLVPHEEGNAGIMVFDSPEAFKAVWDGIAIEQDIKYVEYMEKLGKPVRYLNDLGRQILLDNAESMSHHERYSNLTTITSNADGSKTISYGGETEER